MRNKADLRNRRNKRIAELASAGLSDREIADDLAEEGIYKGVGISERRINQLTRGTVKSEPKGEKWHETIARVLDRWTR